MDEITRAVLGVLMRWIHITSVVVLIGGFFYARVVDTLVPRFRTWILLTIVTLLGSGFYNFVTKPAYPPYYHMFFGIKMLLVLHVFAVGLLLAAPPGRDPAKDAKRPRLMSGVLVSGFCIILISAYLRWISLLG
jgi:hypothetical protein